MTKHAFLDTNIFLHCKTIEQIDLPTILNTDRVIVVISRITIRELDDQKDHNPNRHLRDRARKALKLIETWAEQEREIRAGVIPKVYQKNPAFPLQEHNLDPSRGDDVLVASILQYRTDYPGETVCLISQDTGPRLTAKVYEIESTQLPAPCRLPDAQGPLEKENEQLRRELLRYSSRSPNLSVGFLKNKDRGPLLKIQIYRLKAFSPEEIESEVQAASSRLAMPDESPSNNRGALISVWEQLLQKPSQEEYERYRKDVESYLIAYREYLTRLSSFRAEAFRSVSFTICITNTGTAPAENVDMYFHFPDGFQLFETDQAPRKPMPPREPHPPRTAKEIAYAIANPNFSVISPSPISPDLFNKVATPRSFKLRKTHSYDVTNRHPTIKHGGYSARLPEMTLVFDSWESAQSFPCEYHIQPDNLIAPVIGTLQFVVTKVDGLQSQVEVNPDPTPAP